MIELAFVMLFTAAGIGAALLALRLAGGSALIRGLVWGFCLLALANLALYVWRIVARDPAGSARAAGIAALLAAIVWVYRLFLRAVRRKAGQTGAERDGAGRNDTGRNDTGRNDTGRNRP